MTCEGCKQCYRLPDTTASPIFILLYPSVLYNSYGHEYSAVRLVLVLLHKHCTVQCAVRCTVVLHCTESTERKSTLHCVYLYLYWYLYVRVG